MRQFQEEAWLGAPPLGYVGIHLCTYPVLLSTPIGIILPLGLPSGYPHSLNKCELAPIHSYWGYTIGKTYTASIIWFPSLKDKVAV